MMEVVQTFLLNNTGWLTVFLSVCIVVFTLCIIASPIGSIRIGGRHAKPDFSLWRWFAISLCAGIGIGILFWGIGEPIYHLMQPPTENLGIAPGSHQAAVFAISQSIMHWSVAQYCLYSICGVTFAVMCFNNNRPLSIIDCFAVIVPSRYFELSHCVVHTICLFSLCFAVISSMGSLIMMVSSMLSHLTGLPRSFMMDTLICVAGTGLFVISAISGLRRGMSFLSQQTTRLFIFLMFFVFLVGPTSFILTMGTEVFGYTLSSFFHNSSLMSTKFMDNPWSNSWLVVYMAFFFGYAPPIGLFLARLGKGRTVRQFLLMNIMNKPLKTAMPRRPERPVVEISNRAITPAVMPQTAFSRRGASSLMDSPLVDKVASTVVMGSARVAKEVMVQMMNRKISTPLRGKVWRTATTVDSRPWLCTKPQTSMTLFH